MVKGAVKVTIGKEINHLVLLKKEMVQHMRNLGQISSGWAGLERTPLTSPTTVPSFLVFF
jgi:hypothetical protein